MMVQTGLQLLLGESLDLLEGRRVGLVTQPAAVLPDMTSCLDALQHAGVQVTTLFGPEHGFTGSAADGLAVGDAVDLRTGLPVFSLYGPLKEPTPAMLAEVEVLLFDMQDAGVRYYTYLSTLYYVLRGAAQTGRSVVVLDRPNPIGGEQVEGPLVAPGFESFVGIAPLPIRHGMTLGELALYLNGEFGLRANLTVVQMQGWTRDLWFDGTGLPWVPTSPGMPQLSTATVYPGLCLFEGTNLSEGRGTTLPFEQIGAPWLDGYRLAQALNRLELPGVRFRPVHFEPSASKHAGSHCEGVQVHVTDRRRLRAVEVGLHVVAACMAQAPDAFAFLESSWEGSAPQFDLLAGSPKLREGLVAGVPVADLAAAWQDELNAFAAIRQGYLLYP
jgi:uncharacterized protein YbbC (DUF1343 family)